MISNSILFIIFYFGSFPPYFQRFLQSCAANKSVNWRIYTDNRTEYVWPDNVHRIEMSFRECRELFQSRFDFSISLEEPAKLCDYKPAYGYILEDSLANYDFWGHCDIDQIFGDLSLCLADEILSEYDKMYTLGHFTVYRNDPQVNRCFMSPWGKRIPYREVYSSPLPAGFDEWGDGNINEIFRASSFKMLSEACGADIWPESMNFCLSSYCEQTGGYVPEKGRNCIFRYGDGRLFQCRCADGQWREKEYPYVHMQKRNFSDEYGDGKETSYYIIPNRFIAGTTEKEQAMKEGVRRYIVNRQFLKVKFRNLKQRIKVICRRWSG